MWEPRRNWTSTVPCPRPPFDSAKISAASSATKRATARLRVFHIGIWGKLHEVSETDRNFAEGFTAFGKTNQKFLRIEMKAIFGHSPLAHPLRAHNCHLPTGLCVLSESAR